MAWLSLLYLTADMSKSKKLLRDHHQDLLPYPSSHLFTSSCPCGPCSLPGGLKLKELWPQPQSGSTATPAS